MKNVQSKYRKLESELNDILKARTDEVMALILGHISQTHVVMLGDPGTGKSYLVRKFAEAFPSDESQKVAFFEVALNAFSKPEEVFGPVDINAWKKDGRLVYKSQSFLPNARIAFLDEISRGEAVLNNLLTITNERLFNVNGVATPVPLEMAVSATNFKFSSNEFEAMRDRFLQWLTPKKLDLNDDSILDLWTEPERSVSVRIGEKELETVRAECAAVEFDVDTLNAFRDILRELNDAGIVVSDRRSKAIIRLVKASAWLNERTIMSTGDLECVWTALWADESQIATVKKVVRKFVNPERQVIDEIFENSQILMQSWKVNPLSTTASDVSNQLKTMRQKLNKIKTPKPVNRQSFELTEMLLEKFQEAIAAVIAQKAGQLGI